MEKYLIILLILGLMYFVQTNTTSSENFEGTSSSTIVDDWQAINALAQLSTDLMLGGLKVPGKLEVTGNLSATGTLTATGTANVGSLITTGAATVGSLTTTGAATVGSLVSSGVANVGSLTTTGAANVGSLVSSGAATVGSLVSSGAANVGSLTTGAATVGSLNIPNGSIKGMNFSQYVPNNTLYPLITENSGYCGISIDKGASNNQFSLVFTTTNGSQAAYKAFRINTDGSASSTGPFTAPSLSIGNTNVGATLTSLQNQITALQTLVTNLSQNMRIENLTVRNLTLLGHQGVDVKVKPGTGSPNAVDITYGDQTNWRLNFNNKVYIYDTGRIANT